MKKHTIWLVMALIIITLFCCGSAMAAEIVASGTCGAEGDNLTWELDNEGTLVINGTGKMRNYEMPGDYPPWYSIIKRINNISICKGITSIGDYAFYGCDNLSSIYIPDTITYIGQFAFSFCSCLERVDIPDSVTFIGDYVFYRCISLESVKISESITNIGNDVFSGCSCLTGITIPDGVTSIATYAFYDCSNLVNVTIPNSLSSIGSQAFGACSSLVNITAVDNESISASATLSVTKDFQYILSLPVNLTEIASEAFSGLPAAEAIRIPNSVISIADDAFSGSNVIILAPYGSYAITWAQDHGFDYLIE